MDSWGDPPNVRKGDLSPEENYQHLRHLQKREWWAWAYSVAVILFLTFAVASLSIPSILEDSAGIWKSGVFQSVSGLVFLIFIFACYLTYEKVLINRLRFDLVERQSHSTLWRDLALVDPLTGLYNRRFAERHLNAEISRAQRKGYALTVVLIDLDHFKQINDRYGHAAGDMVLMGFAQRLSKAIRASDIASRLGGDEFMLILTEFESSRLPSVLERLESIQVRVDSQFIEVEFSVGWKEFEAGQQAQELIDAADKALYANKQSRRNLPAVAKS
jgi:diguanylate cyclase (GGDEF)-like protein